MRVELEVRIDPRGTVVVLASSVLSARLPGLRLQAMESDGRTAPGMFGRIVADGPAEEVQQVVARHLTALRQLSSEYPEIEISVVEAGGSALMLSRGTFGAHEAEVTTLLARIVGEAQWQVFVSFRLPEAAHGTLLTALERVRLPGLQPVVHPSPTALAIGFTLEGDHGRVADLVSVLRFVWQQAGQDVETIVEVEGAKPFVERLATNDAWRRFEQAVRCEASAQVEIKELRLVPETLTVERSHGLTWLDTDEQIFGIVHGSLCALSERCELSSGDTEVRRRANGSAYLRVGDQKVELPRAASSVERRLHRVGARGALFSDTDHASTQVFRAAVQGIEAGPAFVQVRGIDADAKDLFAIAEGNGGVELHAVTLDDWSRWHARPWSTGETPTDLAVIGPSRVAVTVERGTRSRLYLVERASITHAQLIALPCVSPQIVGHGRRSVWITGLAPAPGPARCDLFRVDLDRGTVTMATAELDVPTIDVLIDPNLEHALLCTPRAVYQWTGGPLEELLRLAPDEELTGAAIDQGTGLLVRGNAGARLIVQSGQARAEVNLTGAGYVPQFSRRP